MLIGFSGWENTGKSTLAKWLAEELDLIYVPEFAREYLDMRDKFETPDLWNDWICKLYAVTVNSIKRGVHDRIISDPYTYFLSLDDSAIAENKKVTNILLRTALPVYDYIVYIAKEVPKPVDKKHVSFNADQKTFIVDSMVENLEYWRKRGSKIVILNTDSLDTRKEILKKEIVDYVRKNIA